MTADEDAPGEPCSCSEAQAQELHELVTAIATSHGIDLCDPAGVHGGDDLAHALELIHDLSLAQGAECPAPDDDDLDADEPASRFRPEPARTKPR